MSDDPRKIHRVAAAMAVSNYGHLGLSIPVSSVTRWTPSKPEYSSARQEVCDLAGSIMETDEHEEVFAGEAESWETTIREQHGGDLVKFAEAFHWHKEWILEIHNMELPA